MDYTVTAAEQEKGIVNMQVNDQYGPLCMISFPKAHQKRVCEMLDNSIAFDKMTKKEQLKYHIEQTLSVIEELINTGENDDKNA